MRIFIPKEITLGETRVAVIPAMISTLVKSQHQVFVETGAGVSASCTDAQYEQAGATIVKNANELFSSADVVLKVQPPRLQPASGVHEAEVMRKDSTFMGFLSPWTNAATIHRLAKRGVTAFAMEYVPRLTRAQSMDALSSMATVAGYKAVLVAANHIGKMFPLLMTAAGTVPPAHVLILGAGVAGLQAIATAKRLGAKVEAFDPRAAVKEQVKSLGASFVDMDMAENVETAGGYAKEQSEDFLRQEREVIGARLPKVHAVICTAQVFGKRAPVLITSEMIKLMQPGSVVVDLAAEQGGNCEGVEPGKTIEKAGVSIIGAVNLAATVPVDASQMYSKNLINLFRHIFPKPDSAPDFSDEIVKGACITHNGEIVNEALRKSLQTA